ncbi:WD40 repeat domain-containing serine/threonine protein kinase [Actinomadura nitritigenes]|uniref:WD40 repeat domain-containing serine/threonine protein kinase n=1 Tax=Actinomadura nitritigenes TaxID=134602 RepID=UPI003D8B5434
MAGGSPNREWDCRPGGLPRAGKQLDHASQPRRTATPARATSGGKRLWPTIGVLPGRLAEWIQVWFRTCVVREPEPDLVAPLRSGDPDQIGAYRLLGRLGEGGMGRVFLALSPGGRRVAVKLLRPEYAADTRFLTRFGREIEAARAVGGFHTAAVVDADPSADPPWLVTAYMPGPSLQQAVTREGPFSEPDTLALAAALAEGLAAVHACGLVHRDLKPANVILTPDGPRIIDFGIARLPDAAPVTATGAVLGTYAYMSPEQVQGEAAGPASDVFSLGGVLAFAATGRSPFGTGPVAAVVHRITSRPPDLDGVPAQLHSLIAACLAKNTAARPTPSRVLAQATAFQAARPGNDTRTAEDDETVTITSDPSHCSGVSHIPHEGVSQDQQTITAPVRPREPTPPEQPLSPARGANRRIKRRAVLLGALGAAAATVPLGDTLMRSHKPGTSAQVEQPVYTGVLTGHRSAVGDVAFAPDGRTLVSAAYDGLYLWDLPALRWSATLFTGSSGPLALSPRGDTLAAFCEQEVRVWDLADRHLTTTLKPGAGAPLFSPDGASLIVADHQPESPRVIVRLWDLATGHSRTVINLRVGDGISVMALGPDGKTLAISTGDDHTVQLRDWPTAHLRATLRGHTDDIATLAFSPDGQTLASGAFTDPLIRLWDTTTGRAIGTLDGDTIATLGGDQPNGITAVAFSPDGATLASGVTKEPILGIWDLRTRRLITKLFGHTGMDVGSVAFSPNGRTLASGGDDHTIRLWKVH